MVAVGRIIGAWGIRGHVKVTPLSDNPDRFARGSPLLLGRSTVRVVSSRRDKAHLVVRLDAVGDRTTAESLRGMHLAVPREEVGPAPPGSYYHYQIIGMDVSMEDGSSLGQVVQILRTGSNDVYVVRDGQRNETLVPALADVLLEVDPERGRMVVRLPPIV